MNIKQNYAAGRFWGERPSHLTHWRHQLGLTSGASQSTALPTDLPHAGLIVDHNSAQVEANQSYHADLVHTGIKFVSENQEPQTATDLAAINAAQNEQLASYNFDNPVEPNPQMQMQHGGMDFAEPLNPMATVPGFVGPMGIPKMPGM